MSDDPKPDPYLALGLSKDATSQQIKATYRKLALKFHPDKVTDEALKPAAADNFHKIQTAYETLGDESKRAKHDANVRLEELQKAFQKEKEQSSRYRSAPPQQTQPVRTDIRTSAYEVPLQASRGSTYPQPRASERYETFRPRGYDSEYYDDTPASRPTSRKHSYFEVPEPKKHSKSDGEKKKHSSREAEKERTSRHDKSKKSEKEKDRKKDRESKKTYIVPDETDSEPEMKPRRYDSARETSKEYHRKKESSESDDSADDHARDMERKRSYAANYIKRPDHKLDDKGRAASLRTGWDYLRGSAPEQPRRSSARSPVREHPMRADRPRQYSDPTAFRHDMFARPPLEKHNTAPADKFTVDREREKDRDYDRERDRRTKPSSSSKQAYPDHPSLKRAETDPSAHARKPELGRGESRLRYEVNHGMPTPPISPPRDPYSFAQSTRKYVIDEDDHTREVSPGTKPTRRARSPSPPPARERERKSKTTSSRKPRTDLPEAPDARPVLPKLRTGLDGFYTDRVYDSPRSSKPMAAAPDYFTKQTKEDLLSFEVAPTSSRRRSPREETKANDDFIVYDMSPNKERKSSKSSRPKNPHRSYTHAYGSGLGRGIFA